MPERETRGKPGQEYTFDQTNKANPEESWSQASHQERVEAVRGKIEERLPSMRADFPKGDERYFPVEVMQFLVKNQTDTMVPDRHEFWEPVLNAWDALAYEHYQPGSYSEYTAGYRLSRCYEDGQNPVITLSPPQAAILGALTDAVGVKRQSGQNEISIPEKVRTYEKYNKSAEYQDLIDKSGPEYRRRKKRKR